MSYRALRGLLARLPLPRAGAAAVALSIASTAAFAAQATRTTSLPPAAPATPQYTDPALNFLAPYGLMNFPRQTVRALQVFLDAQARYDAGDYLGAQFVLQGLWAEYPIGAPSWGSLPTKPFGLNIGSPSCYYGLRMLSDMADWRVAGTQPGVGLQPRTVRLTVLLVGQSHGIEPQNNQDLQSGTGIPVVHTLDPRIEAGGAWRVHESLKLFREYVFAASQGLLEIDTHILPLPTVDLEVRAGTNPTFAGLTNPGDVWAHVSDQDKAETDWWWILYPSHVPEQYPAFTTREFITGGMGTGPDNQSPFFIIDDRWLLRKPPHLGSGDMSRIERQAYLPQWLQHEFFHHLFRSYSEFDLEESSHQWFNLSTWPSDFVGRYEADYFHEAMYKRFKTATPALHAKMRYATPPGTWSQLTINDVFGTYHREPFENAWHGGDIVANPTLRWRNTAGVRWNLQEDLAHGNLLTGPDCPYFDLESGKQFRIVMDRDQNGDLLGTIQGFAFTGELYERQ